MHLIALNLQRSSAISVAVYGNFTGPKCQEMVVARGTAIELLRPDDTGKLLSICYTPMFSIVRSILPFRLAGSNKDYLIVGSDSGKIAIIEFDTTLNDWKTVHCEVFGKTGCRRIVPGQYLAADPKGRAILIAGVEKQKFVYVMNRDSANRLTISSPLEAHKSETILFSTCGVDVGFDNPIFAMLELEYTEADQDPSGQAAVEVEKKLTFYELDLGLNHVVRKWSEPVSRTANLLLTVPGGDDGPSGVLICGENWVSYKNQGHVEVRAPLPRRRDLPRERGLLITTGTMHKQKDLFFFLLQSELGDLYKVTLELDASDPKIVENVVVTVFDTIPPANSLCITKTGLLFAASEFGNHALFQFQGIGDDPDAVRSGRIVDEELNEELGDDSISASRVAPLFTPSAKLQNLLMTDDVDSLAPITDMLIDDVVGEDSKQIVTLCGKGNRSTLRVLRHGVSVTEMAVSELPGKPTAVWTVKAAQDADVDKYIIVSFTNATLVLSIGENVEEVTDSGFLGTSPTLQVVLLADNALLQVHTQGIRHIRPDQRTSEWKTPGKRSIERAAVNSRQVAISLQGGEIIYFELDAAGQLMEMGTLDLGKEISSLDLGLVPTGRMRSQFLAVGCWDQTVQLLSLDPADVLAQRSTMTLSARPDSVCLVQMVKERGGAAGSGSSLSAVDAAPTLYLNVGLSTGVLIRVAVDPIVGQLSDSRQRFLGPRSIKLFRVMVHGQQGVMALTTRPWLLYNHHGRYYQAPMSYEQLEYASNFASEMCPEGMVAITGNTLRIFTVDNLGAMFNQTSFPLRYTPRKLCRVPNTSNLVVIETDQHEYNETERASLAVDEMAVEGTTVAGAVAEDDEATVFPVRGPVPPTDGKWASCVRVMDPSTGTSSSILELSNNEAAFSVCPCRFVNHSEETFIIVGTAKDLVLHPRKAGGCFLHVYRILEGQLQLVHQTDIEDVPLAMCEFQGKLLVGVGKSLRLYDMGKRKLLKKCENKSIPVTIVRLQINGDRIYVGDMCESVHYVKYRRTDNMFSVFCDETVPRFITALTVLDYDTVGGADKFGNVFVIRTPEHVNDDADGATGVRMLWEQGKLNGAPNKADALTHYYLGEAVTALTKTALIPGGPEVMIAATINGGLFAFVPFTSKEDVKLYQHLEMFMRQECPNLCQRDHLSFRSYFQPVKDTIDGDLCERYVNLPYAKQKELADDVDRTPAEMMKKLEESRNIM